MTRPTRSRTYYELSRLDTFEDRYEYLKLSGSVGETTFGFDRWINQEFYRSAEWKYIRDQVIVRDNGCDLGVPGFEIHRNLLVHHMNPVSAKEIQHGVEWILDPEYLITTSRRTHNAIHYGDNGLLAKEPVVRSSGDTTLWSRER